jgi:putative transposase
MAKAEKLNLLNKTYKFRIYPNKATTEKLQWTLDRCRELYNAALQERKEAWKYAKKSISWVEQCRSLTEIKADVRPEYKEIASHVLQDVILRVEKAYKAFFRRIKNGETPGYPRFQGRNHYDSFTYPDLSNWKLEIGEKKKGKLILSKVGPINVKMHRPIEGKIKTMTLKREGDEWYVVFSCEVETCKKLPYTDFAIGLDLGLLHFATDSFGQTIENPRHYRRAEQKLKNAQQALSRKKRRSNRRKKAVQKVTRAHRKIRNQRKDFLHKQSRILVDTFETIVFEDIQPANLSKRPRPKQDENGKYLPNGASKKAGLNKSILDAGWGMFIAMCEYKAASAGTQVLRVDPRNTSQVCSGCGVKGPHKDLSVRTHTCSSCGLVLDRDHNAALNILKRGLDAA